MSASASPAESSTHHPQLSSSDLDTRTVGSAEPSHALAFSPAAASAVSAARVQEESDDPWADDDDDRYNAFRAGNNDDEYIYDSDVAELSTSDEEDDSSTLQPVSEWSRRKRQQRADADAQELHDAGVKPAHIQPWLRLLFGGSAHPLPFMPTPLIDIIAEYSLLPADAAKPVVVVILSLLRYKTFDDNAQQKTHTFLRESDARAWLLKRLQKQRSALRLYEHSGATKSQKWWAWEDAKLQRREQKAENAVSELVDEDDEKDGKHGHLGSSDDDSSSDSSDSDTSITVSQTPREALRAKRMRFDADRLAAQQKHQAQLDRIYAWEAAEASASLRTLMRHSAVANELLDEYTYLERDPTDPTSQQLTLKIVRAV